MERDLSRRDFLKFGAVTGAAAASAAVLAKYGGFTAEAASGSDEGEGAVTREYVRVNGANILIYHPAIDGPEAKVLVCSMHGGLSRSMESPFLEDLCKCGYTTANCVPDSASYPSQFQALGKCVDYFLETEEYTHVVGMGQSRGAAVMSAYQRIAENGVEYLQGEDRLLPFPDMELTPLDGLMLLDGNFGFMVMHMMSLNPALNDDFDTSKGYNPELDPTLPENGYVEGGDVGNYSEEFRHKFLAAQRERYYRLLDYAKERWEKIQAGEGLFADDEKMYIPECIGTNDAPKLFCNDMSLLAHTKKAWPLLHKDGSVTEEIVQCLRPNESSGNAKYYKTSTAFDTTVKEWLWLQLDVGEDYDYGEDYLTGINVDTNFTISSGNVKAIHAPLLTMGHTGGYEYINAEWVYENAASEDKSICFTEGATHGWRSLDEDLYGDTMMLEAEYCAKWLGERFV